MLVLENIQAFRASRPPMSHDTLDPLASLREAFYPSQGIHLFAVVQ